MCGENNFSHCLTPLRKGSPPRVRGKRKQRYSFPYSHRITPACAGKTIRKNYYNFLYRDHPRVCGENEAARFKSFFEKGSPPRVRGKHSDHGGCRFQRGITPACAGKTVPVCRDVVMQQDHPRVCGENLLTNLRNLRALGSPPRVRGKLTIVYNKNLLLRITPACAGKTLCDGLHRRCGEDHPRVCGENTCR